MFTVDRETLQLVHRILKAEQQRINESIAHVEGILGSEKKRGRPAGSRKIHRVTAAEGEAAIAAVVSRPAREKKTLSPEHIAKMVAGRKRAARKRLKTMTA